MIYRLLFLEAGKTDLLLAYKASRMLRGEHAVDTVLILDIGQNLLW